MVNLDRNERNEDISERKRRRLSSITADRRHVTKMLMWRESRGDKQMREDFLKDIIIQSVTTYKP